jgi:hypothetical protein
MGGRKPFALADEEAWIRAQLAEKPDIIARELRADVKERGVAVNYVAIDGKSDKVRSRQRD